MAQIFNLEVFGGSISNPGTIYYSSPEFNDLLGQADLLTISIIVDAMTAVPSSSQIFKIGIDTSNDGVAWADLGVSTSIMIASASDFRTVTTFSTEDNLGAIGAFARVNLAMNVGALGMAQVRLIACGRTV